MSILALTAADFVALAKTATRDEFERACPFAFLFGRDVLVPPTAGATRTMSPGSPAAMALTARASAAATSGASGRRSIETAESEAFRPDVLSSGPTILGVRKVQAVFPSMITVGRTGNNDLVVADITISKFHAFFRVVAGSNPAETMDLCDAGSRNGTWVGGRRLEPNGAAVQVRSGDIVRFGRRSFDFLGAAGAWERLRRGGGF